MMRKTFVLAAIMFVAIGCSRSVKELSPEQHAKVVAKLEQADSARHADDFKLAAVSYAEAIKLGSTDPNVAMRASRMFARVEETDIAFRYLLVSLDLGYHDIETVDTANDFSEMRKSANWEVIEARVQANYKAWLDTINVAVYNLMTADQADREQDFSTLSQDELRAIAERDQARRDSLLTIIAAGELHTADDYFNAALICQHGADSTWYKRAHEMSTKAAELDSTLHVARWLSAASYDRYLQSVGKPQVYGTQYFFYRDEKTGETTWTMDPYDTTAVTDADRIRMGVGTLAEQRENLLEMQGN